MDVRARARRALSHPSPGVRIALYVAVTATVAVVTASVSASPLLVAGTIVLGAASALAAAT
ncbi:MAG: hypothetical protein ACRDIX_08250 [Actinomycetota bacterium]